MYKVNILSDNTSKTIYVGDASDILVNSLKSLDNDEKDNLINSSISILENCITPEISDSRIHETTGLVFGYVQSGKTLSFTHLLALACDNDYRIAVLIAGRSKLLLSQNTKRLISDLKMIDNINIVQFSTDTDPEVLKNKIKINIQSANNKLIIITVLKHQKYLFELSSIFKDSSIGNFINNKSVLIIDDESDQASFNTNAKKNGRNSESSIFKSIMRLRSVIQNHSYVQYTATPQANLLIDYVNMLSPQWHILLNPGKKYTGGELFFKNYISSSCDFIPQEEVFHHSQNPLIYPPLSFENSLYYFIIVSLILVNKKIKLKEEFVKLELASMMIHPCYLNDSTLKFYEWTKAKINELALSIADKKLNKLKKHYELFLNKHSNIFIEQPIPSINEIAELIQDDFLLNIQIHKVIKNFGSNPFPWDISKYHILIGGPLLDRGFTVENLIVTYMPRDTKDNNNADTIEQRCRFFGYRKDYFNFCKIHIPSSLLNDYVSYVEHEQYLRELLTKYKMSEFKQKGSPLLLSNNLNPTRNSILTYKQKRISFKGRHTFLYPSIRYRENSQLVSDFYNIIKDNKFEHELKPHIDRDQQANNTHLVYKVPVSDVIEFLNNFEFDNQQDRIFLSSISMFLSSDHYTHEYLYVINIAYKRNKGRERTVNIIKNSDERGDFYHKISALDSNFPDYFGDSKLLLTDATGRSDFNYNDEIIMQIHNIYGSQDTIKSNEFYNKSFYTLAFNFVENYDSFNILTNLID